MSARTRRVGPADSEPRVTASGAVMRPQWATEPRTLALAASVPVNIRVSPAGRATPVAGIKSRVAEEQTTIPSMLGMAMSPLRLQHHRDQTGPKGAAAREEQLEGDLFIFCHVLVLGCRNDQTLPAPSPPQPANPPS